MSIEISQNLSTETITKIQSLIQINLDSEKGFLEASKQIEDMNIASTFVDLSHQRADNVRELQRYVSWNGDDPQREGSLVGTLHRLWIDLRASLSGGDTRTILSEAERGEDYIKKLYEDVLADITETAIVDVLTKQYAIVKAGHDRVRNLRDFYAKDSVATKIN